jgi:hypothetical protein
MAASSSPSLSSYDFRFVMNARDGCLRKFISHAGRETLGRQSSELRVFLGDLMVELFRKYLAALVISFRHSTTIFLLLTTADNGRDKCKLMKRNLKEFNNFVRRQVSSMLVLSSFVVWVLIVESSDNASV